MKHQYNLGFISDDAIFEHVKNTVLAYRTEISLKEFNKNLIDPIKLTFDSKINNQSLKTIIQSECIRQMDKTNNNAIGYFHQNLFKYAGNGWEVPEQGFDVVNKELHIYVEMKNKHNTMNSSASQKTYIKMQGQLLDDDQATCMLVEAIAKKSQNIVWETTVDKKRRHHNKIRRVSMDKFYGIVFGDEAAFAKLCYALPVILDDVIAEIEAEQAKKKKKKKNVYDELMSLSPDIQKSLYLMAFKTYAGFDAE